MIFCKLIHLKVPFQQNKLQTYYMNKQLLVSKLYHCMVFIQQPIKQQQKQNTTIINVNVIIGNNKTIFVNNSLLLLEMSSI